MISAVSHAVFRPPDQEAGHSLSLLGAEEGSTYMPRIDNPMEPVGRLKISHSIAAQLELLMTQGVYEVGGRLPAERDLTERFGVGRSTMREALRLVEAEGMLRIAHGVGVFVISDSKRPEHGRSLLLVDGELTVPELFEVRSALDRDAADLAARRITPDETEKLTSILAAAEGPDVDDDEFVRLDARLHRTIAEITKNRLLLHIADSISGPFVRHSQQVIGLPGRREAAHAGHRAIVAAIVARKAARACQAALAHLQMAESDLVALLESRTPDSPAAVRQRVRPTKGTVHVIT
jgi:GntR family transcriptional regulator, transcriptional repressor for pyruvate dehydrogenase complex